MGNELSMFNSSNIYLLHKCVLTISSWFDRNFNTAVVLKFTEQAQIKMLLYLTKVD